MLKLYVSWIKIDKKIKAKMSEYTNTHATSGELYAPLESEPLETAFESNETLDDMGPLYPSVQRAMDRLRDIVDGQKDEDVERTPSGEPILTPQMIDTWAKEMEFGGRVRGTYHNADTYIYIKSCNVVRKEEDIDETLEVARRLTSLGAIHPESQWGVFQRSQDDYQLFVISPKLEAWSLDMAVTGDYDDRLMQPRGDHSHMMDWYKRMDPNFIPGQPIPEDSILFHINWHEASHNDNWGWDETGTLFPVDVEVIRPTKEAVEHKNSEPWKPVPYRFDDFYDV